MKTISRKSKLLAVCIAVIFSFGIAPSAFAGQSVSSRAADQEAREAHQTQTINKQTGVVLQGDQQADVAVKASSSQANVPVSVEQLFGADRQVPTALHLIAQAPATANTGQALTQSVSAVDVAPIATIINTV